ncbi:hypothetical protein A2U01_0037854, partial [Trifolium medium]|nr:hypothetical protein [Trifolium medium]
IARALRAHQEEPGSSFCHLRVAQECLARRAGQLGWSIREPLPSTRRADSYGASRTFIVHHAHCAGWVARRADAKSI